jgi:hypothetical protein
VWLPEFKSNHGLFAHTFINASMQMHANYKVLLLIWNDGLRFDAGYQLLEVFSGEGRVSQKWYHGEHPPAHTSVQQTSYYSFKFLWVHEWFPLWTA